MIILGQLFWTTGKGGFVPPPVVDQPVPPSGGYLHERAGRRRGEDELRRQRQELGIIPAEVQALVTEVAARQAERLELDAQKQYDELQGELRLRNIEIQTAHLEAMNAERERLIGAEIARRLKERIALRDEEELWMLVQIAAQA